MTITAESIYSKGCLVFLVCRKWGGSAKLVDGMVEEKFQEDKEVVSAMQRLLTKEDKIMLDMMQTIKSESFGFIARNSIASPIPNFHFILRDSIQKVEEYLKEQQVRYYALADEFSGKIVAMEQAFKAAHPKLYRADKYPKAAQLRQRFIFTWGFKIISPPDKDLGLISPELLQREEAKFKAEVDQMKKDVLLAFKSAIVDRLEVLSEQCAGGKPNAATVESVNNLIAKFDSLWAGFIDAKEVKGLVNDLKEYMDGTSADMLRVDDEFRGIVGGKMKEIVKSVKAIKESKADRFLDF
jgi:hypothetical protein